MAERRRFRGIGGRRCRNLYTRIKELGILASQIPLDHRPLESSFLASSRPFFGGPVRRQQAGERALARRASARW